MSFAALLLSLLASFGHIGYRPATGGTVTGKAVLTGGTVTGKSILTGGTVTGKSVLTGGTVTGKK